VDPRTKLTVLLIANVSIAFSKSLKYEIMLIFVIFMFGITCEMYKFSGKMLISYFAIILVQILSNTYMPSGMKMMLITFIIFIRKLFPCGILGGIMIGTTRVDEFMTALNKLRIPKNVVISFTIMLRYFPMIIEDWHSIKNAVKPVQNNALIISISFILRYVSLGFSGVLLYKGAYKTLFKVRCMVNEHMSKIPLGDLNERNTGDIKKM
jgi:energy-coupling factor transporter transmembrane protein EcfT